MRCLDLRQRDRSKARVHRFPSQIGMAGRAEEQSNPTDTTLSVALPYHSPRGDLSHEEKKMTTETAVKNNVVWFEIPSADFDRAVTFYETIFGKALNKLDFMGSAHRRLRLREAGSLRIDREGG